MSIFHILIVGVGGFLGAIARFSISQVLNKPTSRLPLGTLIINLSGSFLLGFLLGLKADTMILLLFGTGFAGAFTTFSTLKLELIKMQLSNHKNEFFIYTVATYGGGFFLAYLGYVIGALYD